LSGQALYLKYRPRVFADMIGQEHITRSLQNALAQNRIRHAYLFSGPRGTGKTTLARILAKAVNCLYPDVSVRPCDTCTACVAVNEGRYLDLIEIDAASNNGVDDVRELREKIGFSPNEGRYKVYVIDEVHRFSAAAFDALLKTLEEPPEHAIFVLATTELDKVPATIKSRCLKFEFRRVPLQEVADRLGAIAEFEGLHIDRAVLELVARQGTGSVRDSISLLDQLVSDPSEDITLTMAEHVLGTAGNRAVGRLVQALIDNDVAAGLDTLNQALDEGADPRQFGAQIVDYLRSLLLTQTGSAALVNTSNEQRDALQSQAAGIGRSALIRAVRAFNGALGDMRSSGVPQLPLELALVESTRPTVEEAVPITKVAPKSRGKAAPEPEAAIEQGTAGVLTIQEIKKRWPEIIETARAQDKPLGARLLETEPKTIENETLIIIMRNASLVDIMNEDKNRKALSLVIKSLMGNGIKIKIVPGKVDVQSESLDQMPPDLAEFARGVGSINRFEPKEP